MQHVKIFFHVYHDIFCVPILESDFYFPSVVYLYLINSHILDLCFHLFIVVSCSFDDCFKQEHNCTVKLLEVAAQNLNSVQAF